MTTTPPTLEQFIDLYEAGRDDEAFALAAEAHDQSPDVWFEIVNWYVGDSPPSTWDDWPPGGATT